MRRKDDYLNKIIRILKDLKKKYPSLEISRHIATATSEYQDIWGLPDKEFYYCLERYQEDLTFNPLEDDSLDSLEETFLDEEEDY